MRFFGPAWARIWLRVITIVSRQGIGGPPAPHFATKALTNYLLNRRARSAPKAGGLREAQTPALCAALKMRGPQALPGPQAGQPPGPARREAQGRGAATRAGQCSGVAAGRADARPAKAEGAARPRPVTGLAAPEHLRRDRRARTAQARLAEGHRRRRREAALPGRAREQRQAGAALMAVGHEREKGARRAPARHRCEASEASGTGAAPSRAGWGWSARRRGGGLRLRSKRKGPPSQAAAVPLRIVQRARGPCDEPSKLCCAGLRASE